MTEMTRSSADLDIRRKKALFRSWHRGTREMDLVMGPFANAMLDSLTTGELEDYEALLNAPDPDLFKWVTGERPVPQTFDTPVFRRMAAFRRAMRF